MATFLSDKYVDTLICKYYKDETDPRKIESLRNKIKHQLIIQMDTYIQYIDILYTELGYTNNLTYEDYSHNPVYKPLELYVKYLRKKVKDKNNLRKNQDL